MSLTHEQRYLLEELREYLRRVEKMTARYRIDLDDFGTEYAEAGYAFAVADIKPANTRPDRKAIFVKANKLEIVNYYLPETD